MRIIKKMPPLKLDVGLATVLPLSSVLAFSIFFSSYLSPSSSPSIFPWKGAPCCCLHRQFAGEFFNKDESYLFSAENVFVSHSAYFLSFLFQSSGVSSNFSVETSDLLGSRLETSSGGDTDREC